MKVKEAAEYLTKLAEKYPDHKLSVHVEGRHHTNKILFFAIAPLEPGPYKYMEKEAKKVFENVGLKDRLAASRLPPGVYDDDPPF